MRTRVESGAPLMKPGMPDCCCRSPSESSDYGDVFQVETNKVDQGQCCTSRRIVALLCLLCIGVTILVSVLAALIFGKYKTAYVDETKFLYCLPCKSPVLKYYEQKVADHQITRYTRTLRGQEVQICCGKEPFDLEPLVEKYVAEEKLKDIQTDDRLPMFSSGAHHVTNTSWSPAQPSVAAHLVMDSKHHTEPGADGLFHVHSWSHRGGQRGVVKKHIKYRKGRLLVAKTGIYYVYSQMHFLERQSSSPLSSSIAHYLYKYNRNLPNGGERRLLQNARSRCSAGASFLEYSSYLGAVFRLQAGDQLLVKVNNWTAVYPERTSSYFGLYLLQEDA